jgi:hypothetical protein
VPRPSSRLSLSPVGLSLRARSLPVVERLQATPLILEQMPVNYQGALAMITQLGPGCVSMTLPAPDDHQVTMGLSPTKCQVEPVFFWLDQRSRYWLTATFYPGGCRLLRGVIRSRAIRRLWLDRLTPATRVVVPFVAKSKWDSALLGQSQYAIVPGPLTGDEATLLARLLAHDLYDVEQAVQLVRAALT